MIKKSYMNRVVTTYCTSCWIPAVVHTVSFIGAYLAIICFYKKGNGLPEENQLDFAYFFGEKMTWFSGLRETNAPSHSKHGIIQGFLRDRHLRLSRVRRESESFKYHQGLFPKGRSPLLPFILSSGDSRKIPNIQGVSAFRPFIKTSPG